MNIQKDKEFWYKRLQGQNDIMQTARIKNLLGSLFKDSFYDHTLDYGCGTGRFSGILSEFSGHVTAVDIVDFAVEDAKKLSPNIGGIYLNDYDELPELEIDLLWVCLTFQHIVQKDIFELITTKLTKSLKHGARVVIIDNALDRAEHVKPRSPEEFKKALGLSTMESRKVTINTRSNDHWLISGIHS